MQTIPIIIDIIDAIFPIKLYAIISPYPIVTDEVNTANRKEIIELSLLTNKFTFRVISVMGRSAMYIMTPVIEIFSR